MQMINHMPGKHYSLVRFFYFVSHNTLPFQSVLVSMCYLYNKGLYIIYIKKLHLNFAYAANCPNAEIAERRIFIRKFLFLPVKTTSGTVLSYLGPDILAVLHSTFQQRGVSLGWQTQQLPPPYYGNFENVHLSWTKYNI